MKMKKINATTFECSSAVRILETIGSAGKVKVRISTFLCGACDRTHLQISDADLAGDVLTYSLSMTPIDAEALADALINPPPVDLRDLN